MNSVSGLFVKRQIRWIPWLLFSMACSASEIVAWKVPLDRFGPRNFSSVKVFRMDLEADFKRLFVIGFVC
jgi:hypothetical protein